MKCSLAVLKGRREEVENQGFVALSPMDHSGTSLQDSGVIAGSEGQPNSSRSTLTHDK